MSGIYLRELASQFTLVNPPTTNDAANIFFDDPNTDPYQNTDTEAELNANQTTIDNRAGAANYDIGHLFGTGGGGVAATPSLCSNVKAQGYSARGTQTGDPFVVDYVSHEMGHQFGSSHTYNNIDAPNTGACPQSSYSAADAFEPGSGSTIMSYVGICGARNLQQYVDPATPSFHIRSQTVISQYMASQTVQQCGTSSGTNNIPTVSAGAAYNIPKLTPFTLTATGGDADAGDVANLLYSWEEYDLAAAPSGPAGTPAGVFDVDTDNVQRLTCVVGERLPTINRTMNFRVALRDRRGGWTVSSNDAKHRPDDVARQHATNGNVGRCEHDRRANQRRERQNFPFDRRRADFPDYASRFDAERRQRTNHRSEQRDNHGAHKSRSGRQANFTITAGAATINRTRFDFDGDGKTDIAVYRSGQWIILQSQTNQIRYAQFGFASDKPAAAAFQP